VVLAVEIGRPAAGAYATVSCCAPRPRSVGSSMLPVPPALTAAVATVRSPAETVTVPTSEPAFDAALTVNGTVEAVSP
jgi:hypothetical protein